MPVDEKIWLEDPPRSTWPSNIAYKAAEFQGKKLAHKYLRRMREAAASEGKNLEKKEVLVELAEEVGLDREKFESDLKSDDAIKAFQEDRELSQSHGATGFPTFLIERREGEKWLRGYHSFRYFKELLEELEPDLEEEKPGTILEFVENYDHVATREVQEVFDLSKSEALEKLRKLENKGKIKSIERGNGLFWEPL